MSEKLYTSFEVAKICQVNPATIVRWIHEGKLKAASTGGGHFRILSGEIIRLLRSLGLPIPRELQDNCSEQKILIVDDDKEMRKFLHVFLKKHFSKADIQEAEDGFTAGALLTRFLPNLILLDLKIPGIDGFRVCEFIRQTPELGHTHILVITGMDDEEVEGQIMKLGADDFLHKPFEAAVLRRKIEVQLGLSKIKE